MDDEEPPSVVVPARNEVAPEIPSEPPLANADRSIHDPEFLEKHRRELLALQHLSAAELAAQIRAPYRGDLAIAVLYTLYAFPLGAWVVLQSRHERGSAGAIAIVFCAAMFGIVLWRTFLRSSRGRQRARIYEGRFVKHRIDLSVFDGGEIHVPHEVQKQLVPGVRYRIHAGGTEEIAVDVALDEVETTLSAYR